MQGSKHLSIRVPTRSYLKKFTHHLLGEHIFSDGPHHIQRYLSAIIEKKSYFYKFDQLNNQFKDTLVIWVTKSQFLKSGFGIKPANVINMNLYLEAMFDDELYNFCNEFLKYQDVAKKAIFAFADSYNISIQSREIRKLNREATLKDALEAFADKLSIEIEKDISFEGLKKMEYRIRSKKTFSPVVPTINNGRIMMLFS